MTGIYKITNTLNNKVYIGQSIVIEDRWYKHVWSANHNIESHLYESMRKYGIENFKFEVIFETFDLDYWEKFFIKCYNSTNPNFGYNVSDGGDVGWSTVNERIKNKEIPHPMTGHIWTKEQRENMSKGRKGKYCGKDHYLSQMSKEERKEFVKEKCGTFTAPWWNNGTEQKRSETCPGEGWVRGMLRNSSWDACKGLKFFTNGKVNKRAKECPKGFWPGRIRVNI